MSEARGLTQLLLWTILICLYTSYHPETPLAELDKFEHDWACLTTPSKCSTLKHFSLMTISMKETLRYWPIPSWDVGIQRIVQSDWEKVLKLLKTYLYCLYYVLKLKLFSLNSGKTFSFKILIPTIFYLTIPPDQTKKHMASKGKIGSGCLRLATPNQNMTFKLFFSFVTFYAKKV